MPMCQPREHLEDNLSAPSIFRKINDVPNWTDLSPRLGVAYDLRGDGKTAIKASVGRYVLAYSTDIARPANPANAIIATANRTWNDANGNYVPDCNLKDSQQSGECGRCRQMASEPYEPPHGSRTT